MVSHHRSMSRPAALLALALVNVSTMACAGSHESGDAGLDAMFEIDSPIDVDATPRDAAPIDLADLRTSFCAPYAALVCEWFADCGCGAQVVSGEIDRERCASSSTEACVEAFASFLGGAARVDPARASACIELLRTSNPSCHEVDWRIVGSLCEPFIIEPVAIGEPCNARICADGAGFCEAGACTLRHGAPEPCYGHDQCRTGLACVRDRCVPLAGEGVRGCIADEDCETTLVCVDGVCEAPGAPGDRCIDDEDCAFLSNCVTGACVARPSPSCTQYGACGDDGACGGAWTCEPRAAEGERCGWTRSSRDCAAELYCGDGFLCARRPVAGEPCSPGQPCIPGLACSATSTDPWGTCVAPPSAGEACMFGEAGPYMCADDLGCVAGRCAIVPGAGMNCGDDGRCALGLACIFSDARRCQAPRVEGEACSQTSECAAPLVCPGILARCTPPNEPGEPCPTQSECAGACVRGSSGRLECAETGARGLPCFAHDDCAPELHCTIREPVCIAEVCPFP